MLTDADGKIILQRAASAARIFPLCFRDDAAGIITEFVVKTYKFDETKGMSKSTYIYSLVNYGILKAWTEFYKTADEVELDDAVAETTPVENDCDCLEGLTDLEKRIVEMRLAGKGWAQIRKELHLQQAQIVDLRDSIYSALKHQKYHWVSPDEGTRRGVTKGDKR